MTGLHDTDIRLDEDGQLTQAADGDAPLCSGMDCFLQSIILEAQTQKGELFYDEDFGWSLYDFLQSEDDEITRLEITQRVRSGLLKRERTGPSGAYKGRFSYLRIFPGRGHGGVLQSAHYHRPGQSGGDCH